MTAVSATTCVLTLRTVVSKTAVVVFSQITLHIIYTDMLHCICGTISFLPPAKKAIGTIVAQQMFKTYETLSVLTLTVCAHAHCAFASSALKLDPSPMSGRLTSDGLAHIVLHFLAATTGFISAFHVGRLVEPFGCARRPRARSF